MRRRVFAAIVCLLIIAFNVAVSYGDGKPVRIGYLQNDIHQLACWVAIEKGFYLAEGLEVLVAGIFKAGPEEMSAFAAGALDMGYVGEAPATTAVANGTAHVTVVAQVNTEGSAIVVEKSANMTTLKDLVGKIVAVPGHATVQDFLLKKALVQHSLGQKELSIMVLKPPEMIGALSTGQIGAFIAWEPYPAKAITMGIGRVLVSSREIWKDHPCCVLVADDSFLQERPNEAKAMVRAHVKATEFINAQPLEAIRIGVKYTGMDEDTVRLAMENVTYTYVISREGELEYVDFLSRMRYISVEDPGAFVRRFLNGDYIREITGR